MSKNTNLYTTSTKKVDGAEDNKSRTNVTRSKYLSFSKSAADTLSKRDYGFFKASRTSTHFPHVPTPITDLEAESKSLMSFARKSSEIASRGMSSLIRPKRPSSFLSGLKQESNSQMDIADEPPSPFPEPVLTFEMRRKLFDQAEFTICKGRKITDTFHGVVLEKNVPARSGSIKFEERNTEGNLKELEAFCKAHNFNIIK